MSEKAIAIITARGGSKRIHGDAGCGVFLSASEKLCS